VIDHDYRDARYLKFQDWLLVVCGNAVVTCHKAEAKRWRKLEDSHQTATLPRNRRALG
jgi:hypothetical protein